MRREIEEMRSCTDHLRITTIFCIQVTALREAFDLCILGLSLLGDIQVVGWDLGKNLLLEPDLRRG